MEAAPPQGGDQHQQRHPAKARRQDAAPPQMCPVCLGDLTQPGPNSTLPCAGRHKFHTACWEGVRDSAQEHNAALNFPLLTVSTKCPICRQPIQPQPTSVLEYWPAPVIRNTPLFRRVRSLLRDDDDPAVEKAMLTIPDYRWDEDKDSMCPLAHDLPSLARTIGLQIVWGIQGWRNAKLRDSIPPFYIWYEYIGPNLSQGLDIFTGAPGVCKQANLIRSVLAPLTKEVLERIAEIIRNACGDPRAAVFL